MGRQLRGDLKPPVLDHTGMLQLLQRGDLDPQGGVNSSIFKPGLLPSRREGSMPPPLLTAEHLRSVSFSQALDGDKLVSTASDESPQVHDAALTRPDFPVEQQ